MYTQTSSLVRCENGLYFHIRTFGVVVAVVFFFSIFEKLLFSIFIYTIRPPPSLVCPLPESARYHCSPFFIEKPYLFFFSEASDRPHGHRFANQPMDEVRLIFVASTPRHGRDPAISNRNFFLFFFFRFFFLFLKQ